MAAWRIGNRSPQLSTPTIFPSSRSRREASRNLPLASQPRTYGETLEEARALSADAIEGYLECLQEDGLPLPESDLVTVPPRVDQIRVKLASK
jgi:hypothetical protein